MPQDWVRDLLLLKRIPRTGWHRTGVSSPESVADHGYAAALLAWRVARDAPGVDADRVVRMILVHDFHEARLGDIPTPAKRHFPDGAIESAERSIAAEQWPEGDEAIALLDEFLAGDTPEAALARAVDHLELLLQAQAYREAGHEGVAGMLGRAKKGAAWAHPLTRPWVERILQDG